MTMMKLAGVLAIATFTIGGAFACSSSSSGDSTPAGCTGSGSSTNAACGTCVQSKCGTEYNTCFGSGGPCGAFVSAGCKGLPDASCQTCLGKVTTCQAANCASDCKTTVSDGGVDTGGGTDTGVTRPSPTKDECKTLLTCCDVSSFPAAQKPACYYLAGADDAANCTSGYDGFKGAGFCP